MLEPSSTSPGTIMPAYPKMYERELNTSLIERKISTMRMLGVPYPEGFENIALDSLNSQAKRIADGLKKEDKEMEVSEKLEIIALIAYLQRLGTDIKKQAPAETGAPAPTAFNQSTR
jgi:cytochrome c oxidase cbb3-type subunit I/II